MELNPHTGLPRSIESLKREAKKMKRAEEISHTDALDRIAKRQGYKSWPVMLRANPEQAART